MTLVIRSECPVDEQRSLLCDYFRTIRTRILARVKRICGLDAWTNLSVEGFADEFVEMVLDALQTDFWENIYDWTERTDFLLRDLDMRKHMMIIALTIIESEAEHALPLYAPLLGYIRIGFRGLEQVIFHDGEDSWRTRREKVHDPRDVTIDHVVGSLDAKDLATSEHSRAVSSWCRRLAQKMELSDRMIEKVTRGGLVHDLGKTTTPLEILTAPRRLSDEEWAIMQNHVIAGWEMLQDLPVLEEFQSIVRNHHEKYDGSGYPDGLKGDNIPLSTRIVTVSDCFNAMIGRRPYRVPLSPMGAVVELRRFRKTQFDPDVTDAMTDLVYEMIEKGGLTKRPDGWLYTPPKGLVED